MFTVCVIAFQALSVSHECSHLILKRIGKVGIVAVPLLFLVEDSEMKEVR